MVKVSYLHLTEAVEDVEQEDVFSLDSLFPLCFLVSGSEPDPISLDDHCIHHAGAGSGSLDSDNQVSFVMNLLEQRIEQSHVLEIGSFESISILEYDFGLIDRNVEGIGGSSLELDAGEELSGLATVLLDGNKSLGGDEGYDDLGGFIVSDCGDEFLVKSRSETGNNISGSSTNMFSRGCDSEEEDMNDLVVVELHSHSLQLRDDRQVNDEFEWEEVDGAMDIEESRNLEWEVVLNVNNHVIVGAENSEGPYFGGGHDDYIYTAEYEYEYEM